jgi:hypothetical protein
VNGGIPSVEGEAAMKTQRIGTLEVDLSGIALEEVEVFAQQGKGMRDFAGSCCYPPVAPCNPSCTVPPPDSTETTAQTK